MRKGSPADKSALPRLPCSLACLAYTVSCRIRSVTRKGSAAAKQWSAPDVRALRRHMGLSQDGLAEELGTRQQTVSEWETGRYRPRGASARLLTIIAERAGFEYEARSRIETEKGKGEPGEPGE